MAGFPSVGLPELLVVLVLVVALALFGGRRLTEAGRILGQAVRGFKDALAEESQGTTGSEPFTGSGSDA